jgi:hypothetical protein
MPSVTEVDDRLRIALGRAERAEAEADTALKWAAWAEVERERARAERDGARAERDLARTERDIARAGLQVQLVATLLHGPAQWRPEPAGVGGSALT